MYEKVKGIHQSNNAPTNHQSNNAPTNHQSNNVPTNHQSNNAPTNHQSNNVPTNQCIRINLKSWRQVSSIVRVDCGSWTKYWNLSLNSLISKGLMTKSNSCWFSWLLLIYDCGIYIDRNSTTKQTMSQINVGFDDMFILQLHFLCYPVRKA